MTVPQRAPLPPLWMERNPSPSDRLRPFLGRAFPSWAAMAREGDALAARIRAREIPWPSPTIEQIHALSRNQFGDPKTAAPEFRLTNVLHAAELPSVNSYLDDAVAFMMQVPEIVSRTHDTDALLRRPILYNCFARAAWAHYGRQVYVIDPDTYELLVNTDLPSVPAAVLKAPLPAFYLKFPEGAFHWVDPPADVRLEAEGAIVVFDSVDGSDGWGRSMTVLLTGRNPDVREESSLYAYSFFSPATKVNEIAFPGLDRVVVGEGQREVIRDVPHAILAFCLYMMSEHPQLEPVASARRDVQGVQNPAKRRKIEQRNERVSAHGYVYVGGREMTKAQGAAGTGRKLTHQTWVRGHFRNQPFGPGRTQTKLIWIKPYLKGPDFSETLARTQKIQPAERRD